jgi:cytochrome c oxidase subunit 2
MTGMSLGSLDPKGPYAEVIGVLWWVMLALGVAVFLLFAVLLAVGLRRRPLASVDDTESGGGRSSERARISTWLVGGGVVLPTIVLVVVFATTVWAMRAWPNAASDDAVVIEVVGHQWWYEVHYPEQQVTLRNVMHVPVGERVELRLTSNDVIHSFWVPELGGKMDMLPEDTNVLVLQADEAGTYRARCAEFCGLHHAKMQLTVVAEPRDRFRSWLAGQS